MLWFFVFPCLIFMGWAGYRLFDALIRPKPQDVFTKLAEVRDAKSSGDRWQAAYGLSQSLQKMIHDDELAKLPEAKKTEIFEGLESLLKLHGSDARLKKYVLLTLGQMGDARGLDPLHQGWSDPDSETRFYSLWGSFELFKKEPSLKQSAHMSEVAGYLNDADPAIRKIVSAFLVQDAAYRDPVANLLTDQDQEVRWNAAVGLASVGDHRAKPVLREFFDLEKLRAVGAKTSKDLAQLVATGFEAAQKLNDPEILAAAEALKARVSQETPEGRAVLKGLGAIGR